jgi:uncharacterized damage-inducible protein DinB
MSPIQPWFERSFEFPFPVEHFSNVAIRLRGTPPRLEEMLRNVSREALVRKPGDKWSAQEHAGHLLDLEPLWTARVRDYASGATVLTAADLRNQKTDQANHNARPIGDILREFRSARSSLLACAETIDPPLFSRSIAHPRLQKPMRLVDHLYFVAEHDDHHLARIWELVQSS